MWKIERKFPKMKEWTILLKQHVPPRIKFFFFTDLIFMVKSHRKPILFTDTIFDYPVIHMILTDLQTIISNKHFCIIHTKGGLLVLRRNTLSRLYTVKSKTIKTITFYDSFHLLCTSIHGIVFLVDLRTGKYLKIMVNDCREHPTRVEVLYPSVIFVYPNKLQLYTDGKKVHCFYGTTGKVLRRNTDRSFWMGGNGILSFYRVNKKKSLVQRFPLPRSENVVDIMPLSTVSCVSISEMGTIRIWNNVQKLCLYQSTIPIDEPYTFQLNMYKNDIIFQHNNIIYVFQNPIVQQDYRNFQFLQQSKPDSIFNMYGLETLLQSYLFLV